MSAGAGVAACVAGGVGDSAGVDVAVLPVGETGLVGGGGGAGGLKDLLVAAKSVGQAW